MTPQERDLIHAVAERLRATPLTEKDYEAERFIQSEIGSQPDALYRLTQTVIVQEQGLRHAQERIQQLEEQRQAAQARPASFLNSLFGGGSPSLGTGSPPVPPAPPAVSLAPGGGAVGNFLRSAAATAAGVVGGQLIYDGLRNMFGGSGFAPGLREMFPASPPLGTNQYEPEEGRQPIGGGGSWEEQQSSADESSDVDESLAGGGDFDTDTDDSGDYEDSDSY